MTDEETKRMADLTRRLAGTAIDYKQRCEELEAKMAQQDDLVQAAVAAALREAAKKCRQGDIIYADSAADHILALIREGGE
jgi:hypothetical protein